MPTTTSKNFAHRSYWILLLTSVLTAFVILSILVFLTNQIDKHSIKDTRKRAALVIAEWQSALQLSVEDYAYWTVAHQAISNGDRDAIYDNIGSGATQSELFDWIVILGPDGSVLHKFGFPTTAKVEDALSNKATSTLIAMLGEHDPRDYQSISGAIPLGREVTLFSAAWVTPDDMLGLGVNQLPILIGGIVMGKSRMTSLQRLTDAQTVGIQTEPTEGTEIAISFDGPFIVPGQLTITPVSPGREIRAEMLPWLLVFCSAVLFGSLSLARYFNHLAAQLNRAIALASTDPLTGLSNRAALQSVIENPKIEKALELGEVAVLNIDLNHFKQLNDKCGHAFGDVALQITAQRLQSSVRASDHVVRLGGDEFLCLIVDQNPNEAARTVADRIISQFNNPIDFGSFKFNLKASIGIAVSSVGGRWDDLFRQADEAMYQSKTNGDALPTFYSDRGIFMRPA